VLRLVDHLVGAADDRQWDSDAKRPRGFEVDGQLNLGCLLDRQVARLLALKNTARIAAGEAIGVDDVRAIAG